MHAVFLKEALLCVRHCFRCQEFNGEQRQQKSPRLGKLRSQQEQMFLSHPPHPVLLPSLTPFLSHPGPSFRLLTSPFCSAKPLFLLGNQNELFKTQFYPVPSSS